MINWTNVLVYGGMAISAIFLWYLVVYYVIDWWCK